jgi:hypothetical protein
MGRLGPAKRASSDTVTPARAFLNKIKDLSTIARRVICSKQLERGLIKGYNA